MLPTHIRTISFCTSNTCLFYSLSYSIPLMFFLNFCCFSILLEQPKFIIFLSCQHINTLYLEVSHLLLSQGTFFACLISRNTQVMLLCKNSYCCRTSQYFVLVFVEFLFYASRETLFLNSKTFIWAYMSILRSMLWRTGRTWCQTSMKDNKAMSQTTWSSWWPQKERME